jgi:hypothetical protein
VLAFSEQQSLSHKPEAESERCSGKVLGFGLERSKTKKPLNEGRVKMGFMF